MRGLMIVNMGGPESPEELKIFLSRMFRDQRILPYGKTVRNLLSFIISNARYRKSWKKYALIGGTPLVMATRKTAEAVQSELGNSWKVKYAFSYSNPDIKTCLESFKSEGISDISLVPLYPQASYTTTGSVIDDVNSVTTEDSFYHVKVQEEFYNHPGYIKFWVQLIKDHLIKYQIVDPTLVFSAHSIPEYHIANGDTYASSIVSSAALIATELGLPYEAGFQSGMRRGTWIGPDVKDHLKTLHEEGFDNLVLIPISFVHENLETKYDLDRDIVPYALETLGFSHVSRVNLPEVDPNLVKLLCEMVKL